VLVGRDAERAQLRALLDDARRGRSGALVLRGEAGAGKTALLDDLIAGADDLLVLRAYGVESESELPYAGLHQLLRPVTHEVDGLAPPRADALRAAFGLRTSGGDERFLVSLAVLDLLAEQSERRPVLCVLDDVHRLDRSSVDALAFVARRLEAERIAMVLAVRDPAAHDVPVDDLPTLHLRELGPDPARRLLERRAGGPVHPDVVVRLVTATGGNALALTELARTLTARQLGGAEPLPAPLPLTAGVGQAFERPRQAELLRCTAERTRTRQVRRFDPDRRPEPWNTRPAIGGPVRVAVGTVVPADLDRVTAEVLTPRLLRYVPGP
jgi:ATP/maltotriose-dependent transcriptional regulator MalT